MILIDRSDLHIDFDPKLPTSKIIDIVETAIEDGIKDVRSKKLQFPCL